MALRRAAAPTVLALLLAGCLFEPAAPTSALTLSTGPDRVTASQTTRNDLRCKIGYTLHNTTAHGLFDIQIAWRSLNYGGESHLIARIPPGESATGAIDVVLPPPADPGSCAEIAEDLRVRISSCRSFDGDCPEGDVPRR